jgi:hypothetical protein
MSARVKSATFVALCLLAGGAFAQQQPDDLDVTMQIIVDPDAKLPDEVVRRIPLPARKPAEPSNQDAANKADSKDAKPDAAAEGQDRARDAKELGRDMADSAKQRAKEAADQREQARRDAADDRRGNPGRPDDPPKNPPGRPPRP